MTCGVYLITNKETGQKYVGQSIDIERRWREHLNGSDIDYSRVDKAINKHGGDKFSLSVITELPNNKDLLNIHEKYWVKFYNTFKDKFNYNLTEGGGGLGSGENHPCYGKIFSDEHKRKISESLKGENNPNYGKSLSDENKKKLIESRKGKPLSDEHKKKISEAHKGKQRGNNNNNAKYNNLWDIGCVHYSKRNMFQCNREANFCKCFSLKYNGYRIPIGMFIEPLSCEIINNIIEVETLKGEL